jgi:hypothetical protein
VACTSDGNDVVITVTVQVGYGEIFDGNSPGIDYLSMPLSIGNIHGIIDSHTTSITVIQVVAYTYDQFFVGVIVQIGACDRMSPSQLIIEHRAWPQ